MAYFHIHKSKYNNENDDQGCPGVCLPTPKVYLLPSLFNMDTSIITSNETLPLLLCSFTMQMLANTLNTHIARDISNNNTNHLIKFINYIPIIFDILYMRRIYECNEYSKWLLPTIYPLHKYVNNIQSISSRIPSQSIIDTSIQTIPSLDNYRRNIYCLIIWIGSNSRLQLLQQQPLIIHHSLTHKVISWTVTEDLFPCATNTTKCNVMKTHTKENKMNTTTSSSTTGNTGTRTTIDSKTTTTATSGERAAEASYFMNLMPKTLLTGTSRGVGWAW